MSIFCGFSDESNQFCAQSNGLKQLRVAGEIVEIRWIELSFLKITIIPYIPCFNREPFGQSENMNRHLGVIVGLVLGSFVSLGIAQEDPAPNRSAPPIIQSDELNREMVEAVKAIRQQLGGSIAEQFKDLSNDGSSKKVAEQEFDRELNRLATQAARNPKVMSSVNRSQLHRPTGNGPMPASPPKIGYPNHVAAPHFRQNSPFHRALPVGYAGQRSNSTDLLRDVARRLETMAADLESANLYQEADQIRDQARGFWLKARGLKNNPN